MILQTIVAIALPKACLWQVIGYKQVYIYGALDLGPTVLNRSFGLTWGGWTAASGTPGEYATVWKRQVKGKVDWKWQLTDRAMRDVALPTCASTTLVAPPATPAMP